MPNEGASDLQTRANLPLAWDYVNSVTGKVGDWRVRVANIDTEVDSSRIDLIPNIFINQGEIPPAVKSRIVDTDGDGIISFYDLNHDMNKGLRTTKREDGGILFDFNANNCIDADDLLQIYPENPWLNNIDDDEDFRNPLMGHKEIIDDLIGYNFFKCDSRTQKCGIPQTQDYNYSLPEATHATSVTLLLGATANHQDGKFSGCPFKDPPGVTGARGARAGSVWNVSIAPLVAASKLNSLDPASAFAPDTAVMDALVYAEAKLMATNADTTPRPAFDIINVEKWFNVISDPPKGTAQASLDCSQYSNPNDRGNPTVFSTVQHVPYDTFKAGIEEQRNFFRSPPWLKTGGSSPTSHALWVWAAGNSSYDLSRELIWNHLSEAMHEVLGNRFIMVGSSYGIVENSSTILSQPTSSYGSGVVDIYAPAGSTSFAAPVVSGTAALMLSLDPCYVDKSNKTPCTYRDRPERLKSALMESSIKNVTIWSLPPGMKPGPDGTVEQCFALETRQPELDSGTSIRSYTP